jgi:hypothetical protein
MKALTASVELSLLILSIYRFHFLTDEKYLNRGSSGYHQLGSKLEAIGD